MADSALADMQSLSLKEAGYVPNPAPAEDIPPPSSPGSASALRPTPETAASTELSLTKGGSDAGGTGSEPTVIAKDMLPSSAAIASVPSPPSAESQATSPSAAAGPSRRAPPRPNGLPPSAGPRPPGLPSTISRTGLPVGATPGAGTSAVPPRAPLGSGAGGLAGIRRAGGGLTAGPSKLPPSLQAKMDAMAARNAAAAASAAGNAAGSTNGTTPGQAAPGGAGPTGASGSSTPRDPMNALLASAASSTRLQSSPRPPMSPSMGGLAARRAGMGAPPTLGPGGLSGRAPPSGLPGMGGSNAMGGGMSGLGRLKRPGMGGMTLSSMRGGEGAGEAEATPFSSFGKIVDPSGKLNFESKAILHDKGVDFSNGKSFKINMDEMELDGELGQGNYGTVQRVTHKPSKVVMAMKEIHLELDNSKMNAIIMELDILHRAVAPEIVDFYGAFTIESNVYYCMEFMDGGSLHLLDPSGVPEDVLARITKSIVKGLAFLKDELQVMHRDVKPTNVLINTKGEVKLCDFGVSAQLEKSLAKTNIGCQSYMAPERIKGESQNNLGTYTVSSDVWSVGLSIIELAKGTYPYPPETFANVFAQLQAIVYGPAPTLPENYSTTAQDWVASCLRKQPELRATYAQLLKHAWLVEDEKREVDMVGWVSRCLAAKAERERRGGASSTSSVTSESTTTESSSAPPALSPPPTATPAAPAANGPAPAQPAVTTMA